MKQLHAQQHQEASLQHTMMSSSRALLLLLSLLLVSREEVQGLVFHNTEDSEVETISNPFEPKTCGYDSYDEQEGNNFPKCEASCQPNLLMEPHQIILSPAYMTQADTFLGIATRKILSVPVPIYRFKQPDRLNPLQLPFELLLVKNLPSSFGVSEIPTDPIKAADSWFIGYSWAPIVLCGNTHVGWKFTNNEEVGDYFYALIVATKDKKKEGVAVSIGLAMGDLVADALTIGMKAPSWMISSLV